MVREKSYKFIKRYSIVWNVLVSNKYNEGKGIYFISFSINLFYTQRDILGGLWFDLSVKL